MRSNEYVNSERSRMERRSDERQMPDCGAGSKPVMIQVIVADEVAGPQRRR